MTKKKYGKATNKRIQETSRKFFLGSKPNIMEHKYFKPEKLLAQPDLIKKHLLKGNGLCLFCGYSGTSEKAVSCEIHCFYEPESKDNLGRYPFSLLSERMEYVSFQTSSFVLFFNEIKSLCVKYKVLQMKIYQRHFK